MPDDPRHLSAIQLFEARQFEQASTLLRSLIDAHPSSELWNDWATSEAACGRLSNAINGLCAALSLDPSNQQALNNLHLLSRPSALNPFLAFLATIPSLDPSLSEQMCSAVQRNNSDSSYFVKQAYARLLQFPPSEAAAIAASLSRQPTNDYRILVIAALHFIDQQQWEQAHALLQSAFDLNSTDLFVQRVTILCEHLRHRANPAIPDSFAGLEHYLSTHFCTAPWKNLEITSSAPGIEATGESYFCCPSILPLPVGNLRLQSIVSMQSSEVTREIRKSIHDGTYRYCSPIICGQIAARLLPSREEVLHQAGPACSSLQELYPVGSLDPVQNFSFSYDRSCNLSCPSCRTELFVAPDKQHHDLDQFFQRSIKNELADVRNIYLNGAGEVFFSKHSRAVLKSLTRRDYPLIKFHFLTNGQHIDRRAYQEFDLASRITRIDISIDSARPDTYALIRKGGTLQRLLDNLQFLDTLRQSGADHFELSFRFVVSSLNFKEMPEVVRLAKTFHLDHVEFFVLRFWGQFTPEQASQLAVFHPTHPSHQSFLNILDLPELSDPIVRLGSLQQFRNTEA